nr:uncharacterized protein LOC127310876 [Lolium perenne]
MDSSLRGLHVRVGGGLDASSTRGRRLVLFSGNFNASSSRGRLLALVSGSLDASSWHGTRRRRPRRQQAPRCAPGGSSHPSCLSGTAVLARGGLRADRAVGLRAEGISGGGSQRGICYFARRETRLPRHPGQRRQLDPLPHLRWLNGEVAGPRRGGGAMGMVRACSLGTSPIASPPSVWGDEPRGEKFPKSTHTCRTPKLSPSQTTPRCPPSPDHAVADHSPSPSPDHAVITRRSPRLASLPRLPHHNAGVPSSGRQRLTRRRQPEVSSRRPPSPPSLASPPSPPRLAGRSPRASSPGRRRRRPPSRTRASHSTKCPAAARLDPLPGRRAPPLAWPPRAPSHARLPRALPCSALSGVLRRRCR